MIKVAMMKASKGQTYQLHAVGTGDGFAVRADETPLSRIGDEAGRTLEMKEKRRRG
jgi:hypothetical protein